MVVRGQFSGPTESERVVATRPTRDNTVPPDIWVCRQRFLANRFEFLVRLDSGLLVLRDDSKVILVL